MKKIFQTMITVLIMFLGINGVEAVTGSGGEYNGVCTVKEQYTQSCIYDCIISSDDSHLYFDYKVFINSSGQLSHEIVDGSFKTDGTIFGTNSKEFLEKKEVKYELIDYPNIQYFIINSTFFCNPVVPKTNITYSSHVSGSGLTTFHTTNHEISIQQDSTYTPDNRPGYEQEDIDTSCGILGGKSSEVVLFLQKIYKYLKIIIPVLIIILSIADFIKVIGTGKDDDMKKSINKFIKRIIIAVAFVLVPMLISLIINVSGVTNQYNGINDGLKAVFCILK